MLLEEYRSNSPPRARELTHTTRRTDVSGAGSLEETYAIKNIEMEGFKTKVIDCTMPYADANQPPGEFGVAGLLVLRGY